MDLTQLEPGDRVYAATSIFNDGSVPDREPGALLAAEGTRGLLVRVGHLEEEPGRAVYLVRFEGEGLALGQPVGCWAEDLRADV